MLQVAGGEAPTASLLSSLKFLSSLIPASDSKHSQLAQTQLKCIKASLMFQHTASELWSKGKDAEDRLKKDKQQKLLLAACGHIRTVQDSVAALKKWQEENKDVYEEAVQKAQSQEEKDPDTYLIVLPVADKIGSRAQSEKDDCVLDCLDVKVVLHERRMADVHTTLTRTCSSFWQGGTHDW